MKFSLWTDYGALNSRLVFDAFANSLNDAGHTVVYNDSSADVDVIWSVLFTAAWLETSKFGNTTNLQ